jgi:hypothetical protein
MALTTLPCAAAQACDFNIHCRLYYYLLLRPTASTAAKKYIKSVLLFVFSVYFLPAKSANGYVELQKYSMYVLHTIKFQQLKNYRLPSTNY